MLHFTVLVTPEDGVYIVDVPALVGCHAFGDTVDEALTNAREAIELYVETLRDRGEPIPNDVQTATIHVDVAEKVSA